MDKTVNINLGGSLFQVDEEAFVILRDYIHAINKRFRNVPGGTETIEDIESRIAEIFRSQKGIAGVITRENVSQMIATLGKPEDFDGGMDPGETTSVKDGPRRLYRNPDETIIGGVCGGLGAFLNTDPVIFRILFVLFTILGGAGIIIYLVLWIAVPKAYTETQRREMYRSTFYTAGSKPATISQRAASGLDEVISAIGKVFYIVFRIFLALIGACLVLTGFLFIVSFLMIFVFKIPGAFTMHSSDFTLTYLPEMLRYVFSSGTVSWIWALSIIVFLLPMFALVYWGVKMIFWFRVRDLYFNISFFLIWVASLTALSILLFDQGVSFAERSSVSSRNVLEHKPDTLRILVGRKIEDIKFDNEFSTPDNIYNVFIADSTRNLYIKPSLRINVTDNQSCQVEIHKESYGRNRRIAAENTESLNYTFDIKDDTVILDEYFMLPAGRKWSADYIKIRVSIPENTVLYFDDQTADLLGKRIRISKGEDTEWIYSDEEPSEMGQRYWKVTEEGLEEVGRKK